MSLIFKLSVRTKDMAKLTNQKAFNVRRIFICLGKISRLYHESLQGNCSVMLTLFDQLRKLNQLDVLLTNQLKHLERKIQVKRSNIANKLSVNNERIHLKLTITNPIGLIFAEVLSKLESILVLFEIAQTMRLYKSRKSITNKYNLCLNEMMRFIGQLSNLQTEKINDSFALTVLDKKTKSLLRLAMNHSAMPNCSEKAKAYYHMKLSQVSLESQILKASI